MPVSATAKAACGIMVGVSAENGRVVVSCGAQTADVAVSDRLFIEGLEGKKEVQKVVAALARRGYSYSDIKSALHIIEDENEE